MGQSGKDEKPFKRLKNACNALLRRINKSVFKFGAAVFPEGLTCFACGKELGDGDNRRYAMCDECLAKLPYRTGKYCKRCGSAILEGVECKRCAVAEPPYDGLLSPFEYSGIVRKAVISHKDGNATFLFPIMARHLADYYGASGYVADVVCYVPTSKKAVRRRGTNHTKRVSEYFCSETRLPLIHALERIKSAKDQTENNRGERFENISGAFGATTEINKAEGKKVLLLDDVVTTGATVSECARILKKYGAKEVVVLCFARD